MSPSVPDIQFTCDACGRDVPFMDSGLYTYEYRNQCPYCLCSRHLMFGCLHLEPCGGLMRPAQTWLPSPVLFAQVCEDCGFWWVSYDEDWWAQLPPRRQTEMMNVAVTETARLNHHRLLRFLARPGFAAPPPPPIPDAEIDVRSRVILRPLVSGCADSHGASGTQFQRRGRVGRLVGGAGTARR